MIHCKNYNWIWTQNTNFFKIYKFYTWKHFIMWRIFN